MRSLLLITLATLLTSSCGATGSAEKEGFGITSTTKPVTTASPAGGTYNATQSVTLTASETATIYYTIDGTTPTIDSDVYSGAIPMSVTTTLKFFAVDSVGNSESIKIETYGIAPTITFKSPADGATDALVNGTISATFSTAMNTSTLTTSTFTVDNSVTGSIAMSGSDTIATFTPTANLSNDTTYTVSLGTGIYRC